MHRLLLVAMVAMVAMVAFAPAVAMAQSTATDSVESPEGYVLWSATRVEAAADRLEERLGDQAMIYETIGTYEGHSIYLVLRGQTGTAEFHETESDLYIATRGRATFVIGGELVEPQHLPRKQRRGSAIRGGRSQTLDPGDIVHVPEAVSHHLVIDPSEPFMYILIKFDEEPLESTR